jgi:hypothetical protein
LCMAPTAMMLDDLPSVIAQMRVRQAILTPTVARLMTPNQVRNIFTLVLMSTSDTKARTGSDYRQTHTWRQANDFRVGFGMDKNHHLA